MTEMGVEREGAMVILDRGAGIARAGRMTMDIMYSARDRVLSLCTCGLLSCNDARLVECIVDSVDMILYDDFWWLFWLLILML